MYNAGTDPVITTTADGAGAWTVTGLSTSGVADGTYNVYAFATSATGGLTGPRSSALGVTLDTAPPTIVSVARLTPSAQAAASGTTSVVFRVTYSKAVTGVVAGNFQVEAVSGNVAGSVGTITGGPTAYDVQVTGLTGAGEFRLKVVD
ncbi:MAG: hypothetical protein NTV51_01680 [Verrucomicrobia bacterium]|nr:hypothetical protein [Verrucomicrobiota bacterium]